MIGLYLAGLATGGVLLLFSVLGGGDDADGDVEHAEADADADADIDGDDAGEHVEGEAEAPIAALALTLFPVASIRFWTFFLAFGGLAGALLTSLSPLGTAGTAILAGVLGYASAIGASALVRRVVREEVTSSLAARDCVGASGAVVLPIADRQRGRVRIRLEERVLDFDAETDDEIPLAVAEPVVVYAIREDGVALVTSTRKMSSPA